MRLTKEERNLRRARIVRRWTAYRISRAQREIWRKRRAAVRGDLDDGDDDGHDAGHDELAELPEVLLG